MMEAHAYAAAIEQVARILKGDPSPRHSKSDELRFGTHGSLSVKPSAGLWHDHEANVGGGTLDLVQHLGSAASRAEAYRWLVAQGLALEAPESAPARPEPGVCAVSQRKIPEPKSRMSQVPPSGSPETVYPYRDAGGALLYEVVRRPGKRFMQRRPDSTAPAGCAWNLQGVVRVPYCLPDLLAASADVPVFVVEGEKDADNLRALGLVATCNSGGAGKWDAAHGEHLRDRRVAILPDNDQPGRDHAGKVAASLEGVAISVRTIALPGLPEKGDVSDWLAAGGTRDELLMLANQPPQSDPGCVTDQAGQDDAPGQDDGDDPGDQDEKKPRKSQTDRIVEYARERFTLVHDASRTPHAVGRDDGICRRLHGQAFQDAVQAGFFRATGTAVRDAAWREALMTLRALSRDGKSNAVHLRVADLGEHEHVIDVGEPDNGRCIVLRPGNWEVQDKAPVLFVRPEGLEPLPVPVHGGSLDRLWECANVPEGVRLMVVAWLIEAMREGTPYPGIELVGEQGSGKSFTAKLLRRLIDPNACDLRGAPRSVEDIFVSGGVSHVLTFENLTHLPGPVQDALCIASTGGGHARRTLYTDAEETVIQMKRPWIVNGISVAITQQDLIDRTLSIDLPVIEARNASTDLWRHFVRHQAGILGAILDVAARALALLPGLPSLPHDERPRLIEYADLGRAVAVAMGQQPDVFMAQFNAARSEAIARVLDSSPVASAILDWIEANPTGSSLPMKAWMAVLERYRPQGTDAWPRSPKGLGDAMRRAAPALRQMGIECTSQGKGGGGVVRWAIQRKTPKPKSSMSQAPASCDFKSDQQVGLGTCGTSLQEFLSAKREVL